MPSSARQGPDLVKSHLSTPAVSGLRSLVHFSALARFSEAPRARLRSLRLSSFALALSSVLSVALVAKLGANDVADIVALRIVAYGCFLYGGIGLWTLLSPNSLGERNFVLARLRGIDDQGNSVVFSTIARHLVVGLWISGLPGVIATFFVSSSDLMRTGRVLLILATAAYLLLFGVALSVLGALSRSIAPKQTRAVTFALLLGPFVLHLFVAGFPNLISLFVWGFGQLLALGGLAL